jgi:signal transduction histidine kinase
MGSLDALTPEPEQVPGLLTALSVGLSLVLLIEVTNQLLELGQLSTVTVGSLPWPYIVSFLISLPFIVGLWYGSRYLAREPFPVERNRRIFRWCLVGIAVWLVVNTATMVSFGRFAFWGVVGWLRGAIAWGGAFGLLIGIVEARAITNAVAAEQARLRAEHLDKTRELVDYMNSLIRHEVLNSVNVIHGRGTLLRSEMPEEWSHHDHVETILRRSDDIESVVKDVRTIMESVHDSDDYEPIDLRETVLEEVEKARDLAPNVDITVEIPKQTYVCADEMLGIVFGNLLSNAVEHNGGEVLQVSVSASQDGDAVTVQVADNGSGIGHDAREKLFERPTSGSINHGFGLYIVNYLCERYGGTLELTRSDEEGTVFTVMLPGAGSAAAQSTATSSEPQRV